MAEPMAVVETTDALAGVVAMFASPLLSTIGLTLWERWAGSAVALNLVKCSFGTCLFLLVLASEAAANSTLVFPTASDAWWLTLSSVLGIVLGDVMWLSAFQILGLRAVVLLGTLQPLLAMLAGAALFGQPITSTPYTTLGVFTTCAGLALAALGKPRTQGESEPDALPTHAPPGLLGLTRGATGPALAALGDSTKVAEGDTGALALIADVATSSTPLPEPSTQVLDGAPEDPQAAGLARRRATRRRLLVGGAFAVGNVAFDVAGAVITRAHGVGLSTWTINAIRFGAASFITAVVMQGARTFNSMRGGRRPPNWATLPEQTRRAWALILLGVCLVTFLAPALNAFGLFCMPLDAWTALGALGPVYAVPVLWVLRGEVTPPCGLAGAALAAGSAVAVSLSVRRNV